MYELRDTEIPLECTIPYSHLNLPRPRATIKVCKYHVYTDTEICSLTRVILRSSAHMIVLILHHVCKCKHIFVRGGYLFGHPSTT